MRLRHLLVGLGILALSPAAALAVWLPPVRVSPRGPAEYASPDVAIAAGRAVVTWLRAPEGTTGRVEVVSRGGAAAPWSAPRPLSGSGARAPRAALNVRGDAAVAWVSGRAIVAAVRRGEDGPWSVARVITAGGEVQGLRLAIDRTGRPTVMWSERRGGGFAVRLAARSSARVGWGVRPAQIATPGPTPPALALSPGAGALVAWTEASHTRAARTVNGAFERPVEVSDEDSASPGIALSPGGAALAAWGVSLPGGTSVVLGAGRTTAAMDWAASEDLGIGQTPHAALNDRGDAVVAWSLAGPGQPQGIEATTRRRGGAWQATTVVPRRTCECVLSVGDTAVDGTGAVLVGWRRDDGTAAPGGGGAAAGLAGGSEWTRAAISPGRMREAPAVAAGEGEGGIAVWAEAGPGGGVRTATLRP